MHHIVATNLVEPGGKGNVGTLSTKLPGTGWDVNLIINKYPHIMVANTLDLTSQSFSENMIFDAVCIFLRENSHSLRITFILYSSLWTKKANENLQKIGGSYPLEGQNHLRQCVFSVPFCSALFCCVFDMVLFLQHG